MIFTGGLLAVGIVQAWFFYSQLTKMKESLEEAKRASDISNMNIRPWVRVWATPGDMHDAGVRRAMIALHFKNEGNTPAVDFELRIQYFDIIQGSPTDFHNFERIHDIENVLFPNISDGIERWLRVPKNLMGLSAIGIVIVAIYKLHGSKELKYTPICFKINLPEVRNVEGDFFTISSPFTVDHAPKDDLHIT